MNLILLFEDDFTSDNTILLQGRRAKHVFSVHRAVVGDELTVGLVNGKIGKGLVTELAEGCIKMTVSLTDEPPAPIPVALVLGLPRPKSLKKALHAAITMGVKDIYLINSYRVDKSYWQSPVLSDEGLQEQITLALEQSKDTVIPNIHLKKRFKPFVEDEIEGVVGNSRAIVAHPGSEISCPFNIGEQVTLVVGPEGGFIPYEVELLEQNGVDAVNIGPHILRVEFAIPAILGKLF